MTNATTEDLLRTVLAAGGACAVLDAKMGSLVRVDAELKPGVPGDFVNFMKDKFGPDWVVGIKTENMKSRYTTVISRSAYNAAIREYEVKTGRKHF